MIAIDIPSSKVKDWPFGKEVILKPLRELDKDMAKWLDEITCMGDNTIFYTTPANERDAEQFSNKVDGTYDGMLIDQRFKGFGGATEDGIFWK